MANNEGKDSYSQVKEQKTAKPKKKKSNKLSASKKEKIFNCLVIFVLVCLCHMNSLLFLNCGRLFDC